MAGSPSFALLLEHTYKLAAEFYAGLPDRPVGCPVDYLSLLAAMDGPLPETPQDPLGVLEQLVAAVAPGLVATPGPRYFGFVIGGSLPAALAADWMTTAWDQNAFSYATSPAAAVAEEIARKWLIELLGLPPDITLGLVTGGTMANFTCLASARHALLRQQCWDVEEKGLTGAPAFVVLTSEESHVSILASMQMLGMGRANVVRIPTDDQGRMRPAELKKGLAGIAQPPLVCAQAGNVNTGAFDPIAEIAELVHTSGGWLHVDGAFGGWAAAAPAFRHLMRGIEQADSFALDAHKWLNVPYDSGLAFVRDADAHYQAMTLYAPYYSAKPEVERDNHNWVPEASRRARGFAVYAAIRSLGRQGLTEMIERCCQNARRMAALLAASPSVRIMNDVVLNQVLVRFGDSDSLTTAVIRRIQEDGACWLSGTTWHGMTLARISVSNWSTTEADIDASAAAILRCASEAA